MMLRLYILLAVSFGSFGVYVAAQEPATPQRQPIKDKAVVSKDECLFAFPIDDIDRKWKWGVSDPNACEYSWMVTVTSGDTTYQLGFSYFNAFSMKQQGDFQQLLVAGQSNLWELEPDGRGATYVDGVRVRASTKGDYLQLAIKDRKWVQRLFKEKPKAVKFETTGTQLLKKTRHVAVQYRTESESTTPERRVE